MDKKRKKEMVRITRGDGLLFKDGFTQHPPHKPI